MITLSGLSKNFDQRLLLDDVSLGIFPKERIGLTGPNGAGKTTLFSLILGQMEPSSGTIAIQKNIKIGYLPQEAKFASDRTVMDEITAGDDHIRGLLDEKRKLEDAHKADTTRYGDILEELEVLGIYDIEHRAEKVLAGLGFKEEEFHKPIIQLSGGWQMRTLLAKLLTYEYDLLLLDEPTNYLDLPATLWLKDYLATYPGAFIMISHDKIFLNDVTNYTIVLEDGKMTKVKGNYEEYEANRDVEKKSLEKRHKVVEKKRQQLERFAQRFHAQPNRASAVKNKQKMLERMETIDLPTDRVSIKDFEFPQTVESGYSVITMRDISKAYDSKVIYEGLNFEITKGQKICLVGPNGAGKSTLLKMLAGVVRMDKGHRKLGHQVKMGYFSQTRTDVLNPTSTALDELMSSADGNVPAAKGRSLLGLFNFHGDDVFKQVSVLSGGEKSRLILAKLLINPPNFILLDEPTTHLDIHGVEALTKAFRKYKGTLCFISHDLFFIKEIANHIVEVQPGDVKHYHGGMDYFLDKKSGREASAESGSHSQTDMARAVGGTSFSKKKKKEKGSALDELAEKHKDIVKRLNTIKSQLRDIDKEEKELETESYVKARTLSEPLKVRDPEMRKEYGMRLKDIQTRLREIGSIRKELDEEKRILSQQVL